MKTIIVFYPYNNIAVDQLSVIQSLKKKFKVILLIIDIKGNLHEVANKLGIENLSIFEKKSKLFGIINKKIFFISKFLYYTYLLFKFPIIVKNKKANFVFAHLEIAGLISSFYENILNYKSFYFRHNTDAHIIDGNYKSKLINTLVNSLAKKIVCVSSAVKYQLIHKEKVDSKKLYQINYGYDFKLLHNFKSYRKNKIKKLNRNCINLITIGRLVDLKRQILIFKLMLKLSSSNNKYNLLCLGSGANQKKLKQFIKINKLKNVFMLGYKKNILDYIKNSNILIHFSQSESFGHVVLEAALAKKTVIVCKNVGIFNSLINDGINGFLVSKKNPIPDAYKILNSLNKKKIKQLGFNLHKSMIKKYHISNYEKKYFNLLK